MDSSRLDRHDYGDDRDDHDDNNINNNNDKHHHRSRPRYRSRSPPPPPPPHPRSPHHDDPTDRSERTRRTTTTTRARRRNRNRPQHRQKHTRTHNRHKHQHNRRTTNEPPHRTASTTATATPITLPLNARPLSRHDDYGTYEPLFAMYLDIQKGIMFDEIDERERRGRWKSFWQKWNRGELAEGWYHRDILRKAWSEMRMLADSNDDDNGEYDDDDDADDAEYGPTLPKHISRPDKRVTATGLGSGMNMNRSGPTIPSIQDLQLQKEMAHETHLQSLQDLHHARKLDRKQQREQLDEIAPRAEPGTRERRLEKKRERAEANRDFANNARGGGGGGGVDEVEVADADLMGARDDEDGPEGYRKRRREMERKRNERRGRREEVRRARAAEREVRMRRHRQKEERIMAGLKALAKDRFG